ncbi:LUD domain-containing protein [Halomicrococcus sp. NG-SE-24]|uniref:LUD domain-containing protein n=1 Tax=Halomicrococcus sp. NG-SE-24 TaxID=3436928 RepID=UPI003D999E78
MDTEVVAEFESSLRRLDVGRTKTTTDEFDDALADVVSRPAVGAPLPFDRVSLPDEVTVSPTPAELEASATGVTAANFAIASYGSVVIRATPEGTEPVSLFPDRHVAVVRKSDIVPGMTEAFERLGEDIRAGRDSAVIATGPSATADMGSLVRGAHGPKDVQVVVLTDR